MSGYTADYNRTHGGTAHAIIGYTLDGGGLCPACADSRYPAAILSGEGACGHCFAPLWSCSCADYPAPILAVDAASYREGGDHRGGCGLSCDPCGAIIVAACDPCREGIEGGDYAPATCAACASIVYYPDERVLWRGGVYCLDCAPCECGDHAPFERYNHAATGEGGRPMA